MKTPHTELGIKKFKDLVASKSNPFAPFALSFSPLLFLMWDY